MTKHILILEPDRAFAARLEQALRRTGAFVVATVATVKEACLRLRQERQEVAFIAVMESAQVMRCLRVVQPDLRLVLMTATAETQVPAVYLGQVQGVLIKSLVDVELPMVMAAAINQPFLPSGAAPAGSVPVEVPPLDTDAVLAILQQAKLGRLVQTVVFSQAAQLLAHWGELTPTEAATVALHVVEAWDRTAHPARVQFVHLPARAGDLLLYSCSVAEDYLLTLVALPETPLNELRSRTDKILAPLVKIIKGSTTPLPLLQTGPLNGRTAYAIVWRPVRPLPPSLHIPLRRALERLAAANACVLTHTLVRPELVHLVVTCPPGRDSAWAAYLFKNGSEQVIQQQFGVAATLWDKGFYAVESADPLATAELNIFLEHNVRDA